MARARSGATLVRRVFACLVLERYANAANASADESAAFVLTSGQQLHLDQNGVQHTTCELPLSSVHRTV